jgi:GNAT superfamily N-acetyltransferase
MYNINKLKIIIVFTTLIPLLSVTEPTSGVSDYKAEHEPAVQKIACENIEGFHSRYTQQDAARWLKEDFNPSALNPTNTIKVYIHNDKPVGFMVYKPTQEKNWLSSDSQAFVSYLAVDRDYQGKGIAKKMMGYLVEECKKDELENIKLRAFTNLRKFYLNLGFKEGRDMLTDGRLATEFTYKVPPASPSTLNSFLNPRLVSAMRRIIHR